MLSKQGYVAIRRNPEGREWMDTSTISLLADESRRLATKDNELLGSWGKANPVVRIEAVSIVPTSATAAKRPRRKTQMKPRPRLTRVDASPYM